MTVTQNLLLKTLKNQQIIKKRPELNLQFTAGPH